MNKKTWCVIVNPASGRGITLKKLPAIEKSLQKHNLYYKIFISNARGHIVQIAKAEINNGYRNFVVVGGDGTLHELVNGIFSHKKIDTKSITIGVIPVGTGNDWAKNNQIDNNIDKSISLLANNVSYLHDVGVITFPKIKNKKPEYFINFAGIGFDSVTVEHMASRRFGHFSYILALLKTFLFYSGTKMQIVTDKNKIERDVFTMMTCLGKYVGGGMFIAPQSIPDDGLFDITIVKSLGKWEIIKNLALLYNGKILSHPKAERLVCKNIRIVSGGNAKVQADGELLGLSPVEISIIKRGIRVIGQYPII